VSFGNTAYFKDNVNVIFGDDDDLQILHDGSQNAINSYTVNPFNIISNGDTIIKTNNNESMAIGLKMYGTV